MVTRDREFEAWRGPFEGRSSSPPRVAEREYRELEDYISSAPESATIKGMFVQSLLQQLERARQDRPTKQRYVAFKNYPLRDFMRMALDSVFVLWPGLSPREGLRRLGHDVYPTLRNSTVGRVIFSLPGADFKTALGMAPKAYSLSLSPATAELRDVAELRATLQLRNVWNFPHVYQVGVMEGAMAAYRVRGTVTPHPCQRPCDVDLLLEWKDA